MLKRSTKPCSVNILNLSLSDMKCFRVIFILFNQKLNSRIFNFLAITRNYKFLK